ncbi:DUF58 domain-containing protein [Vibrio sp.]|nr:DUF58 domain-containing protein [Vibrio sp.]
MALLKSLKKKQPKGLSLLQQAINDTTLPSQCNGVSLSLEELLFFKIHSIHWQPPAKGVWAALQGKYRSRQLGRGMDFSEVRLYQPGDDIRTIDWRVTARTGKTHTKIFNEEREKPVIFYVDLTASMYFGSTLLLKSLQAAHLTSLLAWIAFNNKDRVGAVIDTPQGLIKIRPSSQKKSILQILQAMIDCHHSVLSDLSTNPSSYASSNKTEHFHYVLQAIDQLAPKGSDITFISDFHQMDSSHSSLIHRLNRHNQLRFAHLYDELEQGVTQFTGVELVASNERSQWVDFSSNKTKAALKSTFEERHDFLHSLSQQNNVNYYAFKANAPLLTQIPSPFI